MARHPAALTRDQAQALADADEMIDIALHPAALMWLWDVLDTRGIGLIEGPREADGPRRTRWFVLSPDNLGPVHPGA